MMRRVLAVMMVALLGGEWGAGAQQAGPDQKKMDPLVGVWRTETEIKTGPSAGRKTTAVEQCHWFANWHVVCLTEGASYSSMRTMSYIAEQKKYASYVVDNSGAATLALGELKGDAWTFVTDAQGTSRVVMTVGKDSYTLTSDFLDPAGKWLPRLVIKAVRQK